MVSGKAWRKRAKEARNSDEADEGKREQQAAPLKRLSEFIDNMRQVRALLPALALTLLPTLTLPLPLALTLTLTLTRTLTQTLPLALPLPRTCTRCCAWRAW